MVSVPSRHHLSNVTLSRCQIGAQYELLARRYLERAGLHFHAANISVRGGELDLIMRDGSTWVFIEVRYRANDKYGDAAATINYRKRQRLLHSAACWLAQQGDSLHDTDCRFDVLAITGRQIQWLHNAITAE